MKLYEVDLSEEGITEIENKLKRIDTLITDEALLKYVGNKAMTELKKICSQKLTSYDDKSIDTSYYANSNHLEIDNDTIYIYNDSTIDIASKNMKETTKANYPAQLSLAKIVEYGIGYTGMRTDQTEVEDWEYDVNNHGYRGWYYEDSNGQIHWTNGFEGRLIFLNLKKAILNNIENWINEYIEMKL